MKFALIPARGGSKRIPNKNIKSFNGKPIIAYSIEAAIESQLFDHVVVSTDSQDIANVAREYGADVPFLRPDAISDDYATTREVITHAVNYMTKRYDEVTHCCCIYATSPLLQISYLKQGLEKLLASPDKAFAFSVTEFAFPVQRALSITNGHLSALYPQYSNTRSQDLNPAYHDAGQFYWGTIDGLLSDKAFFSSDSIPIVLPSYLVQDIDTPDDWLRAELMHKAMSLSL
ncbi:pseudaminic acid cytidylyltransferase [Glaciecola sp. XM2]|jgi:N-acylneuraminate cytidylyltransferase|uniref:pseudaminic acid cytidylyltransferase n=1 Tax=Glaciecola sp. XM2 TaxID=1914931 RepID=UPI001BDF2722|nr:pseudaminic acid cytidylyltransferase [Glaciecola sp. XM2]MBT1450814.1 pseudaminic acid cytidylyltransferase [Glaciecola sp. XM2]